MLKTAYKYILIIIIGLSTFWSCEPCDDCGPDNAYPYFNLSILNKTSLDTLSQYRNRFNDEIAAIDEALSNPDNAPFADSLNNLRKVKSDSLALTNALISTVNEKVISIESINERTNLFENRNGGDSLSRFRIPINTLETSSEYIFKIEFADSLRYMKIEYQLNDTIINDKITKSVKDLRVIEHQFDSLRGPFGCRPLSDCISNELEIYVEI
jgi:hypothetical protein